MAGHCAETADCATAIVEAAGSSLAAFFGLDDADEARLEPLLRMAALIHDLGKAGAAFQAQMHQAVARALTRSDTRRSRSPCAWIRLG